jgi:hypothetical protein
LACPPFSPTPETNLSHEKISALLAKLSMRPKDSSQIKNPKPLHWDATSRDYLQYRPDYPRRFFILLRLLGIGLPGQKILDLGSGTGALD